MEDQERIIYYILKKELPFCEIGDQTIIVGDELIINKIHMPIEYANSDFFTPVTLAEHQINIKKGLITFLMEKLSITEEEAEIKSKTFWNKK